MAAPETSAEAVEQAALGPKRVTVNGQSVEQHPIPDLIKAAEFTQKNAASAKSHFGIRRSRFNLPGANR